MVMREKRSGSRRVVRVSVKNIKPLKQRLGEIEKNAILHKNQKTEIPEITSSSRDKIKEEENRIIEALKVKPPSWEYTDNLLEVGLNTYCNCIIQFFQKMNFCNKLNTFIFI